jgi:hypothetical protein
VFDVLVDYGTLDDLTATPNPRRLIAGNAAYLMTRR